ncbi:sensor histidine kinase [Clostridium sp. DJ247]|uniref:sensor histidine kinase n=1 Tax=Clostridium sp. DJ247 TaxID=2726188 RepID=UPI00162614C4|nr:sensor histidine kinase [Clostridium sp. DJ247]MBC2580068.1 HAMP domain-containing histidine kinase [Clostridium sp. DJ247]
MRINDYIKGQMELMISIVSIFIVVNLILFASTPLDKSLGEIFYLDLLIMVTLGVGCSFHYRRIKKAYERIQQVMAEGKDVNYIFEKESNVLGVNLIKQLLEYKDKQFMKKEENYQQKMNNLKDYITQTVHDIKVNLAVCEMVTSRFEDEDGKVNKLIFQIEQMKFRINQALYVTRANYYSEDIVSEYVDIENIVKKAISDNAEFFISKGIEIHVDIQPHHFISDAKWVHYIITQILNNSSKYTKKHGEVSIFSKEDDKGYYLYIKDNGIGIKKEEIVRVFDKGFTGSNGRGTTKSTGMGMYYAKKMADTLGISIGVQSEKEVYTEFILSFYKLADYINHQIN